MFEADSLENHIPFYPEADVDFDDYNAQIYRKHEFRRLAADKPRVNSIYRNHQRSIQVYLGPQTGNTTLMVYHDPGLGKTCTGIGVAETRHEYINQFVQDSNQKEMLMERKPLIIAQNPLSVESNFKKDALETCTDWSYMTKEMFEAKSSNMKELRNARTRTLNTGFEFSQHEAFTNIILKIPESETKEKITIPYSNRVIIIDEVHEFKTILTVDSRGYPVATERGKKMYNPMLRFLDNVYGCLIVIMSATPVVDKILDFPSIFNLALPRDERINPYTFRDIVRNAENLQDLTMKMEELLIPKFLGRVSRMETSQSDRKTVIRTNENVVNYFGNGKQTDDELWLSVLWPMDHPQNREKIDYTYLSQIHMDVSSITGGGDENNQLYSRFRDIDNIIWPDGTYGTDSVSKYVETDPNGNTRFKEIFFDEPGTGLNDQLNVAREDIIRIMRDHYQADEETIQPYKDRLGVRYSDMDFSSPDTGDVDIITLIRVIRSRYSPMAADVITQSLGIEWKNDKTGLYEYHFSYKNLITDESDPEQVLNKECVYIYNEFLPTGSVIYGLLFGLFGFERYNSITSAIDEDGNIKIPKKFRYCIMHSSKSSSGSTDETMTDAKSQNLLLLFNHPDNKYGEYLKILIGTPVSAQGINFLNARQAHMTSRFWNRAGNIQAETRADRPGNSHRAFLEGPLEEIQEIFQIYLEDSDTELDVPYNVTEINGQPTQKYVKMFRHVSYNEKALEIDPQIRYKPEFELYHLSLGIRIYDRAYTKNLQSSVPLLILEKCAYDLKLNNIRGGGPTSMLEPYAFPPGSENLPIDYSTYNIFYSRPAMEPIKSRVRSFFKTNFYAKLSDLVRINSEYHSSTIIKALTEMVKDQERLIDRHGMLNYLVEEGDVFILQKTPKSFRNSIDRMMSYYTRKNHVRSGRTINEIYDILEYEKMNDAVNRISLLSPADTSSILKELNSLSLRLKSYMIESLVSNISGDVSRNPISLEMFEAIAKLMNTHVMYAERNGLIIHTLSHWSNKITMSKTRKYKGKIEDKAYTELRIFSLDEHIWRNSTVHEGEMYIPMINDRINTKGSEIRDKYPYFGSTSPIAVASTGILDDYSSKINFYLQENFYIKSTSMRKVQGSRPNKKTASTTGTNAFRGLNKDIYYLHLFSVKISMYCLLSITLYDFIQNGKKITIETFILYRMREISEEESKAEGVISFLYNGVYLTYYTIVVNGNPYPVSLNNGNHQVTEQNRHTARTLDPVIIHYTEIYPEIVPWLYADEIKAADPDVINPNKAFYPERPGNSENLSLPPYLYGRNYYGSLLEILPNELMERNNKYVCKGIGCKLTGVIYNKIPGTDEFNNKSSVILGTDYKLSLAFDGNIITSVRQSPYYQRAMGKDVQIGEQMNINYKKGLENESMDIPIDKSFYRAWANAKNNVTVEDLAAIIFCVYYLTGRIIEN